MQGCVALSVYLGLCKAFQTLGAPSEAAPIQTRNIILGARERGSLFVEVCDEGLKFRV